METCEGEALERRRQVIASVPAEVSDPVNARILAVSEDRIAGFLEEPFAGIARLSGVEESVVPGDFAE